MSHRNQSRPYAFNFKLNPLPIKSAQNPSQRSSKPSAGRPPPHRLFKVQSQNRFRHYRCQKFSRGNSSLKFRHPNILVIFPQIRNLNALRFTKTLQGIRRLTLRSKRRRKRWPPLLLRRIRLSRSQLRKTHNQPTGSSVNHRIRLLYANRLEFFRQRVCKIPIGFFNKRGRELLASDFEQKLWHSELLDYLPEATTKTEP